MKIEYSDVEVCSLKSATPDTICGDIKPCSCLRVGGGTRQFFVCQGLEFWLNRYVFAPFRKEGGCQVPDLVTPDRGEAAFGTGHGMFDGEGAPQALFVGSLSCIQTYRRARATWNAPLCREKPCSVSAWRSCEPGGGSLLFC